MRREEKNFKYKFIHEEVLNSDGKPYTVCKVICENAEVLPRHELKDLLPAGYIMGKVSKNGETFFIPPDYKRRLHRINGIGLTGWKKLVHTFRGWFV